MPELPEVDTVRRSLEPHIAGRRCRAVTLLRPDIVDGPPAGRGLLEGAEISAIRRRGKQLALVAKDGRVLVVHLGMTGRLIWNGAHDSSPHVHALWRFDGGGTMRFVDPRRFGGLTPLRDVGALERRWAALGPDALTIGPEDLRSGLRGTRRAVKAALLDQRVLAGVGNIYADESLFQAGVHPLRRADLLDEPRVERLAAAIRRVLTDAVRAGGSTLRDYVNADGMAGSYAAAHAVYGRSGLPCVRCGARLRELRVAQRSTVLCPRCQPKRG